MNKARGRRVPPLAALRALEAAARLRSYSRAGKELALTHSAISQQIRNLEAQLGTKLFVRQAGSMIPIPAAQRLAGEVVRAMGILQDALSAVEHPSSTLQLVVSVDELLARRWLPKRLSRLFGRLNLEIRVDNAHTDFLHDGIDASVRYGDGRWEGLESRLILPVQLTPLCSPEFARRNNLKTPQDLAQAPLLHCNARPWSLWFEAQGIRSPEQGLVFDDTLTMLEAAMEGLGAVLFSPAMAEAELGSSRLVRPFKAVVPSHRHFFLVWRADSRRTQLIHEFYQYLLEEASPGAVSAAS